MTRIVSAKPPGTTLPILKQVAALNHWGMYALVFTLCGTGVGMGIQSGAGIPFFGLYQVPGRPDKNVPMAQYCFKMHKYAGVALEYGVALHIVGYLFHLLSGQNYLKRMLGPLGGIFLALPWLVCGLGVAYSTKPEKLPDFPNWMSPPPFDPPKEEPKSQ